MTRTSCPRSASQAAMSPEYLPIPVGSGAKFALYMRILITQRCKNYAAVPSVGFNLQYVEASR